MCRCPKDTKCHSTKKLINKTRLSETPNLNLYDNMSMEEKLAVENFRKYLRIPSVQPNVDYDPCVEFISKQANGLALPFKIHHPFPNKPVIVITWVGQEPSLPTILLNSHMDVVPVIEADWKHKPFAAEVDEQGNIYARGAQDMKCVGIQYLEAIRRLKKDGVVFKRTVHVSFVPDEEIGGVEGMEAFVKTKEFQDLNVGFALDEGMPSEKNDQVLFYGERAIWQMHLHCPGEPGHASLLLENTAGEKVRRIMDKFYDFRAEESQKLQDDPSLTIGDVTTINVTQLQGGVQANVIPPELVVVIDCRLPGTLDLEEWEKTINQWCKEAGEGVWIEYLQKQPIIPPTKLDESNPYWVAFKKVADALNIDLRLWICPGSTDAQCLRKLGIRALGFSPMDNTSPLLHRENEYLNVQVFLRGINIYKNLISAVANVPDFDDL